MSDENHRLTMAQMLKAGIERRKQKAESSFAAPEGSARCQVTCGEYPSYYKCDRPAKYVTDGSKPPGVMFLCGIHKRGRHAKPIAPKTKLCDHPIRKETMSVKPKKKATAGRGSHQRRVSRLRKAEVALEGLVALATKSQPPTEAEIERFCVEYANPGKPLSKADTAALEKARPELFQKIHDIIHGKPANAKLSHDPIKE